MGRRHYSLKVIEVFGKQPNYRTLGWTGISILNPIFKSKGIGLLFHYLYENFDEPLIVIGDYLYRHNMRIFYNVDEITAIKMAMSFGDGYRDFLKACLQKEKLTNKILVRDFKEVYDEIKAATTFKQLKSIYMENALFKKDIDALAIDFVDHQASKGILSAPIHNAYKYSVNFLLEELALKERLYAVKKYQGQIYPGQLSAVFQYLSKNKYGDLGLAFDELYFTQIKIKKH
jgi:hypothetical protein